MTLTEAMEQSAVGQAYRVLPAGRVWTAGPEIAHDGVSGFFVTARVRAYLDEFDDWQPIVPDQPQAVCPDCRGAGKYVGLQAVEMCATCTGRGHVPAAPTK